MYNNYKVKCLVFAGREKYLRLLMPQLLECEEFDEIMICINTKNEQDLAYINSLPDISNKIKLYNRPDNIRNHQHPQVSYLYFYTLTRDIDTIYFKVDDDIVYIEPGCIKAMLDVKINTCNISLFVFPHIINNPFFNCISDNKPINKDYMNKSWSSGDYAADIHNRFINNQIERKSGIIDIKANYTYLGRPDNKTDYIRPSINFICYFGFDMNNLLMTKNLDFIRIGDEQLFVCDYLKTYTNKINIATLNVKVAHWSFFSQYKKLLEKENALLTLYENKINTDYKKKLI